MFETWIAEMIVLLEPILHMLFLESYEEEWCWLFYVSVLQRYVISFLLDRHSTGPANANFVSLGFHSGQ